MARTSRPGLSRIAEGSSMAAQTCVRTQHATLSGTTADSITFSPVVAWAPTTLAITNHHATEKLWFRPDGVTAVALADETFVVLPGQTKVLAPEGFVVSVVGNGNVYSVEFI